MKATHAPVLWLPPGVIVQDAIRGREYRIEKFLGQGGFGAAYRAIRLTGASSSPKLCVLKVTIDAATWHSEAYFGHLLQQRLHFVCFVPLESQAGMDLVTPFRSSGEALLPD